MADRRRIAVAAWAWVAVALGLYLQQFRQLAGAVLALFMP